MATNYTTISGDTWDIVARNVYGLETMCSALMAANPDHVGTVIFPAGIVLDVPDMTTPTKAETTTPPWRAGS